ncbi:MAG TPA: DUF411 domain-containing protein [Longimicrobiales bacterium]|nr:DUF411 domain-containing protein [Longimicrobiales bacterium]
MKTTLTWAAGPLLLLAALAACGQPEPATERVALADAQDAVEMVVYKTPTCGCCNDWIDHMRAAGFPAEAVDTTHAALQEIKKAQGVPAQMGSCHTAVVNGYVVEGHVPAEDVARMIRERPDIRGLTVPGMPMGSPGMEGLVSQRYDVIAIGKDGTQTVWASH